jgi:ATP-dependent DNA helicase PIF1
LLYYFLFLCDKSIGMSLDQNEQFLRAIELLENTNKNVFITGKAGTGKSTLLNHFRNETRKQVAVLAPTGVAAVNIKGETIHSFFHFKPDVTLDKAREAARKVVTATYKSLEMIIIDEISMVRADLMDCIDEFLKITRKSFLPFGGVQMVFIGDLYQLPPVVTRQDKEMLLKAYKSEYFFAADVMQHVEIEVVNLEKIYRQQNKQFVDILNRIRENAVTDEDLQILNARVNRNFQPKEEDMYVYLTTTNQLAGQINKERLQALPAENFAFRGRFSGEFDKGYLPADDFLELKVGAQVMMVNNDPQNRWINGTIGKVVQIQSDKEGELVRVEFNDGSIHDIEPNNWDMYHFEYDEALKRIVSEIVGSYSQYPLKLAWAMTIHKSQGKTFDKIIIDLGFGAFAHGQVYVALSRCTSLEGIILKQPIRKRDVWVDKNVNEWMIAAMGSNSKL